MQNLLKVTKHNALIASSYRLSLMEIRIVLYGISLINPTTKEFPISYKISISKFANIFQIKEDRLFSELKDVVIKEFWERDFSYIDEKGKVVMRRWLTDIVYHDGEGHLEIFYNPNIKKMLHNLQDHFTSYYLDRVKGLKSMYSIRVYELCIMEYSKLKVYNKVVEFSIKISYLRDLLGLETKYKYFRDIRLFVLEKAKKEINKQTDIKIDYKVEKVGRTPYEIEFSVKLKKTEEDFKKAEIDLLNKDIKEKERRTNHSPIYYSSTNVTTLDTSLQSILNNLEKDID